MVRGGGGNVSAIGDSHRPRGRGRPPTGRWRL